jgi:S1-C subfamily serine protease
LRYGCLIVLALCLSHASAAELADTIDKVRPSVVGIGTSRPVRQPLAKGPPVRFSGTGFVVGNGRQVVTNFHVVPTEIDAEHKETIAVFVGRGEAATIRPAQLMVSDPEHDLALLEFEGPPLKPLILAVGEKVREGDAIAFTGFPIGVVLGLYPVTHRGIVSVITPTVIPAPSARALTATQLKRMKEKFNVYQLDATAYPGNSGSPVYRPRDGSVIGVVNSVYVKETKEAILEKPSGITYAVPVEYVEALLNQGR